MAKKRNKSIHCTNCEFQFKDANNFCPNCGQENHSHNVPLKELFLELLETTLHFDTKLLLTLKVGFLKPGQVVTDFIEGKRMRYVPPFRFYIFISIIFFISLGFFSTNNGIDQKDIFKIENNPSVSEIDTTQSKDPLYLNKVIEEKDTVKSDNYLLKINIDSIRPEGDDTDFAKKFTEKLNTFAKFEKKLMYEKFTKFTSYFMFFFMPFSALFLLIFYFRKQKNYYEYLVFSIYTHSFIFIIFTLGLSISNLLKTGDFGKGLIFLGASIYFLISLKNVFQQSWPKTIFKFFMVSFLYLFTGLILLMFFIMGGIYLT